MRTNPESAVHMRTTAALPTPNLCSAIAVETSRDRRGAGIPLLSDLRQPPVVGRYYMVPVVRAVNWAGIDGDLPVIGPAHTDVEHFNFRHRHYHVDARFLTAKEKRQVASYWRGGDHHSTVGSLPLTNLYSGGVPRGLPTLARRKCTSNGAVYRHDDKAAVQALRAEYGTPDAIMLADGRKLCPHRKADLSQFKPDKDGFVVCPLHGLLVRCSA